MFISVIIPAFNREGLVGRAIRSALADPEADFEVVVVDDGSTDDTPGAVAAITDSRVRLIRLPENRGWCPARNAGAVAARGEWLVFLDSDDELIPGGLDRIRQRAAAAGEGVGKLLFMLRDDGGLISPDPPLDGRVVGYEGYVKWMEESNPGRFETLSCTRRAVLLECPYPNERFSPEGLHDLDFAKRSLVQMCPDVVRLYHYDAANRVMLPSRARLFAQARGFADHADAALERHGAVLRQLAPRTWSVQVRQAALFGFLSGDRRRGVARSITLLWQRPTHLLSWVVLVLGVIGRRPLADLYLLRLHGRVVA